MLLFSTYVRENEYDNEMCNYCLQYGASPQYKSSKCTCSSEDSVVDFKMYEKLLPTVVVTELHYFYDPYTRYVYVLNQAYVVLRVYDLDELESKHEDDLNGFDYMLQSNVYKSPLLTLVYTCCTHQKGNYTLTRFLKPFETAVSECVEWLESSFTAEEVSRQLVVLFSVVNNDSWYEHKLLCSHPVARDVWRNLESLM